MKFEATINDTSCQVSIKDQGASWWVSICSPEKESRTYEVSKADYQQTDSAIQWITNKQAHLVSVHNNKENVDIFIDGIVQRITMFNEEQSFLNKLQSSNSSSDLSGLSSEMPGKIVKVFVKSGDPVKTNDPLLIIEAMKMENEIRSPKDGVIKEVYVSPEENIGSGVNLISFEEKTNKG